MAGAYGNGEHCLMHRTQVLADGARYRANPKRRTLRDAGGTRTAPPCFQTEVRGLGKGETCARH